MADTITNKPRRKYSCEQIYERMESGLCLFCEELDSPGHYELKHKRTQIFLIECDVDPVSDEKELVPGSLHQKEDQANTVVEEKLNLLLGKNIKHLEGKHSHKVYTESISHIDFSLPQEHQEDSVKLIKSSKDVKLPFSQEYSPSRKSALSFSEMVPSLSVSDCTIEKRITCLSREDRVWEPGGLLAKQDLWNLGENRNHDDMLELTSKLHGKYLQRNTSKGMTDVSAQLDRLETFGWEYKKCRSLFVNQGSKVEESSLLKLLRDSEMYSSCREFEWFLRYGDVHCLNGFCTNRKRPLDPGITKMYRKLLVCLGVHNMEFEVAAEVYSWAHHDLSRPITNNALETKKLHEMSSFMSLQTNSEVSILLPKETRDWFLKAGFKIPGCSGFDLASWNGMEIHGCENKKHTLLLVKQASHVWDRGGLIATCARGSIPVQSDISFDVLAYAKEEKKLKNIEADAKKGKNNVLDDAPGNEKTSCKSMDTTPVNGAAERADNLDKIEVKAMGLEHKILGANTEKIVSVVRYGFGERLLDSSGEPVLKQFDDSHRSSRDFHMKTRIGSKKKQKWSKSWRFKFKGKSEAHKLTDNIIFLVKDGVDARFCVGFKHEAENVDMQSGSEEDDFLKLSAASSHNKSLRLLYGSLPRPPNFKMVKDHKKAIRFLVQWKEHPPDQATSELVYQQFDNRERCQAIFIFVPKDALKEGVLLQYLMVLALVISSINFGYLCLVYLNRFRVTVTLYVCI